MALGGGGNFPNRELALPQGFQLHSPRLEPIPLLNREAFPGHPGEAEEGKGWPPYQGSLEGGINTNKASGQDSLLIRGRLAGWFG